MKLPQPLFDVPPTQGKAKATDPVRQPHDRRVFSTLSESWGGVRELAAVPATRQVERTSKITLACVAAATVLCAYSVRTG
jgi:hypothetical protein